ncbi:hypothetical protein N8I77_001769 [Diaporthe amygdali]|uniref:DNA endonuclease activator Ctp1 C-terminal domain-containing protein n=1 Tax=Phomopsis amygdali TaxID=1214568 RepID=A0AAD9WB37_PHOAM|nr:hypothetical protein N8I77_001769 [Diaporthe amygdali]
MSTWLRDSKSAIQEAVEDAFNQIQERAQLELRERDRRNDELSGQLQQLKDHAATAVQLQLENESLRKQVQKLLQSNKDREALSPKKRRALGELSPNKLAASRAANPLARHGDDRVDYEKEYNKLHAKYDILEKSRDEYKSVLRQRTVQISKWAETSDKQKVVIERLRKRLAQYQSTGVSGAHPNTPGIGPLDVSVDEPERPSPNSSFDRPIDAIPEASTGLTAARCSISKAHDGSKIHEHPAEDNLEARVHKNDPANESAELPKLPEQQDDDLSAVLKVELSSDGPVFVSERPVHKRKRGREDEPKSKQVQRIKSEHSSSGPEYTGEIHSFTPTESFDFEEDIHVPTPRKRRVLGQLQQHAALDGLGGSTMNGSSHAPLTTTEAPLTPTTAIRDAQKPNRTSASHEAIADVSESEIPSDQQPGHHITLQLDLGIRDLAEDGDADLNTVQRPAFKGRLDALLNSTSVRTPKPKIQPASHRVQTPQPAPADSYEDALRVPARRELPHGKKLPSSEASTTPVQQKAASTLPAKARLSRARPPKRPSILRDDMPRGRLADKEKAPLRQKPMDRLRPEDFKPNPRYNDGLTYVYDEVVRGREARSALSGCTDPNCCGKTFRSFAEAERSTIGPSVTTRAEDIKLLENYLGDDAFKLGSMTRDEKEETWILAKTWELAGKFGRHRERYARMPSPPGFWTVEFPSTQERAEERRQAEEIQKALVHERYREAMRPGGRWLFRDEEGR